MSKSRFLVFLHSTSPLVHIYLDGYGPGAGEPLKEIGSFDLDIEPDSKRVEDPRDLSQNGEHIFIHEARKVLHDYLPDGINTSRYQFVDKASQSVPGINYDENPDLTTDGLPETDPNDHPDLTDQAGGEETEGPTPAMQAATGGEETGTKENAGEPKGTDSTPSESSDDKPETVVALKERIASITDKAELQKEYDAEASGQNRPTAIKAIEDRAKELEASE